MNRVSFQPAGPTFSRLALGTWRVLDDPSTATPEGLLTLIKTGLDAGLTTLDTAEIYGLYQVEALLGRALALDPGVKARVEIVTKAGIYVPHPGAPERRVAHYEATSQRLIASAEASLRLLGVEALDLFLVHRPDWLTSAEETATGINTLIQQGKIRAAGTSNYTTGQFEALDRFVDQPLSTNQVEFSPFCMAPLTDGTFDQAQRLQRRPMAWSPTGGGRLFLPENETAARLRTTMSAMSPRYADATPSALCLAWILAHPAGPLPVIGTNRPERLREYLAADSITLSREDWYALWEAGQGRRIP
jgi:predicted oxidoreductase